MAALLRRRRFTRGLIYGWDLGVILVAAGTAEILRFLASLGTGCGSGIYHTPW